MSKNWMRTSLNWTKNWTSLRMTPMTMIVKMNWTRMRGPNTMSLNWMTKNYWTNNYNYSILTNLNSKKMKMIRSMSYWTKKSLMRINLTRKMTTKMRTEIRNSKKRSLRIRPLHPNHLARLDRYMPYPPKKRDLSCQESRGSIRHLNYARRRIN
jgi:hypothetical protein